MEEYLKEELDLDYLDLCKFLQYKYGTPKGNYFLTESCEFKNNSIERESEGLFLHHINENTHILLSKPDYAVEAPFEYQKAENLCYCNYLEHMILHMKIVKEYLTTENIEKYRCLPGIGELIDFIVPEINDYVNGYQYERDWQIKALSLVDKKSFKQLKSSLYDIIWWVKMQESGYVRMCDLLPRRAKSYIRGTLLDGWGKMTKGPLANICRKENIDIDKIESFAIPSVFYPDLADILFKSYYNRYVRGR